MNPRIIASICLAIAGLPAMAEDEPAPHPILTDKFIVQAGAFFPKLSFDASVNGNNTGEHPIYDFEGQFGLKDNQDIAALEFQWRYRGNWSLRGQYYDVSRSASTFLQSDVEWGEVVFQAGSNVRADTGLELLRLFFARNFSDKPNHEYGIGLGIHRLGIGVGLAGEFLIDGVQLSKGERAVGVTAPLPNIGGWYDWSPAPKWQIGARIDWMQASIGDYSGGLTNLAAGANYQAFSNVGFGLKYQRFTLNLDVRRQFWDGSVKLNYEGLYVYLSGNWN